MHGLADIYRLNEREAQAQMNARVGLVVGFYVSRRKGRYSPWIYSVTFIKSVDGHEGVAVGGSFRFYANDVSLLLTGPAQTRALRKLAYDYGRKHMHKPVPIEAASAGDYLYRAFELHPA